MLYLKFKESDLYKKYSFISEDDILDFTDNCVVTRKMVYYSTLKLSTVSAVKGYLKYSLSSRSRKLEGLFDSKTYKEKIYNKIDIDHINSIDDDSVKTFVNEVLSKIKEKQRLKEELRTEKKKKERLEMKKKERYLELVRKFDKDNNGTIDVVEGNDFSNILKKNQEKIIEINRDYIKQFVQVSNYLKLKRKSLQNVFESLNNAIKKGGGYMALDSCFRTIDVQKHVKNNSKLAFVKEVKEVLGVGLKEAKEMVDEFYLSGDFKKINGGKIFRPLDENLIMEHFEVLKDDIHIYNLLLVHSLNMVGSLIKNDMITFYEIYEKFDELNMFDSKHERDLRNHLQNVNENLGDVMNQIQIMGESVMSSIGELSMINEESSKLITDGLDSVNSSIEANNLINSVQTYQLYRIGKNIKSLRG